MLEGRSLCLHSVTLKRKGVEITQREDLDVLSQAFASNTSRRNVCCEDQQIPNASRGNLLKRLQSIVFTSFAPEDSVKLFIFDIP
jgi:hypothetical protein